MSDVPPGPPEEGPWDDSDRIDDEVRRLADDEMQRLIDAAHQLDEQEQTEVAHDDELLDQLGGGEALPGELADMLGAWRDDVDSVPHSPGTDPDAIQQIHDFTEEIERATAPPPRPIEGAPPAMTTMEDAARIRGLGEQARDRALASINTIEGELDTMIQQLQAAAVGPVEFGQEAANILGTDHPGAQTIINATGAWADSLAPLVDLVTQMRQTATEAQGGANQVQQAFNDAASMLSGGGAG